MEGIRVNKSDVFESIANGLIVSCQAVPNEPHYMDGITLMFAKCADWAGAAGLRVNSPEDIKRIKAEVNLPIIGIWKINRNIDDVYLTPSLEAAKAVWDAGAEIIGVQATHHLRQDGKQAYEIITEIKNAIPEALIFADISNKEDAAKAIELGADFIAPTLAGYTQAGYFDTVHIKNEPNYELLEEIVYLTKNSKTRVIMEGKVNSPEAAKKCIDLGAYAVVVGNAITRPHITAKRFVDYLKCDQDE